MLKKTILALGFCTLSGLGMSVAQAAEKVTVVTSFSILKDWVKQVGGDRVEVVSLVPENGDAHEYDPTPQDVAKLSKAQLFIVNGLGFDDWSQRLVKASGYQGDVVVATEGIDALKVAGDDHDHHHDHDHDHSHDHDHDHDHDHHHHHHGEYDPHAWQDLANARTYVANITKALVHVDAANQAAYEQAAKQYDDEIVKLNESVKARFTKLSADQRQFVTNHDAFSYFAKAYDFKVYSAMGMSSASQPSAKVVAQLIDTIKHEKIPALFFENTSNRKLVDQIARDSGATVGGKLYSDALDSQGEASHYLGMFEANVKTILQAVEQAKK